MRRGGRRAGAAWPATTSSSVDAEPASIVEGARDELHRLALNLIENAVHHTPPGTHDPRRGATRDGDDALLTSRTTAPASRPSCATRIFERFVSAGGDRGASTGLGLAIVRAVAQAHGGDVDAGGRAAAAPASSSRLPARADQSGPPRDERVPAARGRERTAIEPAAQTSTTTGSTIGRLRRRS